MPGPSPSRSPSRSPGPFPSVDEVLRAPPGQIAIARFGHAATLGAVRASVADLRARVQAAGGPAALPDSRAATAAALAAQALEALTAADQPRLRRVINLTGTVLHTNLGRAVLAESAIAAAGVAMRHPAALEFDLDGGGRGERDDAVRGLIGELTGAEDVCLVNNNAAALFLVLNTLAQGRESVVSRGELIEIGGAFRLPEIMARAGTRLREVGTTNRTHPADYAAALGAETGLLLKVHTSNYLVQGFTAAVDIPTLAAIGRAAGVPVIDDLGSGTLIDLARYGLKRERTVQDALGEGADLVTFSGDKLLGGPQAGFIAGRRDLVRACAKNPIKRAVRLDKIRLAALEATLRLYRDPDRLPASLPTLRFLTRPLAELQDLAGQLAPALAARLGEAGWQVAGRPCASQIGSGALPLETIPSHGLALLPAAAGASGRAVEHLAAAFRRLPLPVIGRIDKGALLFDLRCLDDAAGFLAQLDRLAPVEAA